MESIRSRASIVVTVVAIFAYSISVLAENSCEGGQVARGTVVGSMGVATSQSICIASTYAPFLGGRLSQEQADYQHCAPYNLAFGTMADADFQWQQYVPLKSKDQAHAALHL